MLECFS